jgi:DNA-binding Xre family transcriptional regulator
MEIRLKITENIKRWNTARDQELPKKTMKSLASEVLKNNKGDIRSRYVMLYRMNTGRAKLVRLIDIVDICYALNCTPNDLIDWTS